MPQANENSYHIIPRPAKLEALSGVFLLDAKTLLVAVEGAFRDEAESFASSIAPATGFELTAETSSQPKTGAINFVSDSSIAETEGYRLKVEPEHIEIRAATAQGAFYAIQSLRQLLPAQIFGRDSQHNITWAIPAVAIDDQPSFPYRGMHLDVSRHFFSVEFVKGYIDLIAAHKMNRFHWHLTDDQGWRIEIKKYPGLTEVGAWRDGTITEHALNRDAHIDDRPYGGFYTQDEIREVVAYAAARHVEIIPEIDVPGHALAVLAAYPEYACVEKAFEVEKRFGIFPDVLCPKEATFSFLEDVFVEVASLFPGPYIHIGGDEVLKDQWQECEACRALMRREGLSDYEHLHGYFVTRMESIIKELGKQVIGWDEILAGEIAPSATIMSWRGVSTGVKAANKGHPVIMAPGVLYFDAYQSRSLDEPMAIHGLSPLREVYHFNPLPQELSADRADLILGAQGNLWSEYIPSESHAQYMILPRMSALAEVVWTPREQQSWPDFVARMKTHFQRLDAWQLTASRSLYKVRIEYRLLPEGKLELGLSQDEPAHQIRYSLDGSVPGAQSLLYEAPLLLSEDTWLRAAAIDPVSGESYGDSQLEFKTHKALAKHIRFHTSPDREWNPNSSKVLVDGVTAGKQILQPSDWALFGAQGMDLEIDLAEETAVSYVEIGHGVELHRKLYAPTGLEVRVSNDAQNWRSVGRLNKADIKRDQPRSAINFDAVHARYVRVIAENDTRAVRGESSEAKPVALFVDEIIIK